MFDPTTMYPSSNGLISKGEQECIFDTYISLIQVADVFPVKVSPDKDERSIGDAVPPLFQSNIKSVPDKVPPVTYVFVSALAFGSHSPSPLLPVWVNTYQIVDADAPLLIVILLVYNLPSIVASSTDCK